MQMPKTAGFNRFCLHVEGFQLTLIFQCVFCLQTMATDPQNKPKDPVSKSRRSRLDEPIAPDGGWGWVILFASFLSAVIVDGVCFSFGIFYLEFLSYYQENKGKTAWIGSVLNGTYMIMGKWTSIQSARDEVIISGLLLGLRPANERRRYFVTTSLIGWTQT